MMSIFQSLQGNVSEVEPAKAQKEFQPLLVDGERVIKAFKLFRDMVVMTDLRLLTLDKQGVTGSKQAVTSIPYGNIKKFSKEGAGWFELDAELCVWLSGDPGPIKWDFSRGVDINEAYKILSTYVLKG